MIRRMILILALLAAVLTLGCISGCNDNGSAETGHEGHDHSEGDHDHDH